MPNIMKSELFDQDLKKHVAAIHIENRLSLLERKMANVLLLNAYPHLLSQETHRVRISDLAGVLGFDSNDRECLKKALVNLMSTVFVWNIIDQQGNEKIWRARPMLMSADIERSWCIYSYHPDLRRKLFNPEIYSRINLSIQRKFTSGYALALYENCLRYRSTGSTGWWPLEIFRKLLGVGDNDYYSDFRRLNSKIIKPAIQQVNNTSDILLEAETKLEKRRVVSIRFSIKENPQMSLFAARPELAATSKDTKEDATNSYNGLRIRLLSFGLREQEVNRFMKEHNAVYINENLDIVADMQARKAIKTTLRAAALDALRTDYRPKKAPYEIQQEVHEAAEQEAKLKSKQKARHEEQQEYLRREFERYRLDAALDRLSVDLLEQLKADFVNEIIHGSQPTYKALQSIYQKHGLAHAAVQGCFRHFARDRLLNEATEEEFEAFLKNQRKM